MPKRTVKTSSYEDTIPVTESLNLSAIDREGVLCWENGLDCFKTSYFIPKAILTFELH